MAKNSHVKTSYIEGELTIYKAHEIKQLLLIWIEQTNVLEIDLSGVTECDSAGIQLLILTKKIIKTKQKELYLINCSSAIVEVLDVMNLKTYFQMSSITSLKNNLHVVRT